MAVTLRCIFVSTKVLGIDVFKEEQYLQYLIIHFTDNLCQEHTLLKNDVLINKIRFD